MRRIGVHLSYANMAATLALLFAMSGGALAANHFLINSTRQINPKVLSKLKGPRGPAGAPGSTGATGPAGATGATGSAGAKGLTGERGPEGASALSPLPSFASESGTWGVGAPGGKAGETLETGASFPVPLEAEAPEEHVITTGTNAPVEHCSGPGNADPGFLCIYINREVGVEANTKKVFDPEIKPSPGGSGRFGFMMAWTTNAPGAGVFGSYTVTAG